mmetsp:Transcript_27682/g.59121  ORF Transcript_27682/g.59121 Transcript_27682/m.59121 type:complete len:772 (-) Transcript_27682:404-2719(-)|eukprot:CAMPEP_0172320570 /NCGR_PEP_ID=MMETSP1058-20130122/40853_1 /TAXON_ID=83371 /ORGANISM="Detonula confervacea, Strain CCMP 353" /LENGTH=771 /DNA_ID=CAMNT_0013035861 /DNA_START=57 /DNA_END=2372 /DNA_ORIENTATION=-
MKPLSSRRQKSLKPLLEVGQPVYSAYWSPTDPDRELIPDWYPGVVSSYKVSKLADDDKYGYVRYYSVNFDDGDVMTNVRDHFIMDAEEYLLHLRDDEDESHSWLGVKNVVDKTSNDAWAKHVGWYVATFDEEEHTFSLISDALRAYDSYVVRTNGLENIEESDLNLAEDWTRLFAAKEKVRQKKDDKKAAAKLKEQLREGIKLAQKKHRAELDRLKHDLQREHDDATKIAVHDAVSTEKRRMREEQHHLKNELKARHMKEMKVQREKCEEEKERAEEEAAAAVASQEKLAQRRNLKPQFDVGEEVYAAWWPDMAQDTASWFSGHVKSYHEVKRAKTNEDDDYGPTRLYQIKYDDDGTELDGIPEQFVFPKNDYLLSTSCPSNKKWKGVKNALDESSNDPWARLVGWYTVAMTYKDREEEGTEQSCFSRLSDALRAYDASIVRQKGDKTKSEELNLPDEWEWLFNKNGLQQEQSKSYDDEELQKEKEKLKRKLDKRHGQEIEIAVREALVVERKKRQAMQTKLRKELKEHCEKEKSRAVEEAKKVCDNEHALANEELREDLLQQFQRDNEKAWSRAVEKANKAHENKQTLAMEKLRGELLLQYQHDKEKALYWLRVERQQMELELARMKEATHLSRSLMKEKVQSKKLLGRELDLTPPPAAKRAKVGSSSGGLFQLAAAIGSVTPPNQPRGSFVKDISPPVNCSQLYLPPLPSSTSSCSKKQLLLSPKDQSAGEETIEDKDYGYRNHNHAAIANLLVAAAEMESEEREHDGQ